jgi:hypothetical protein
VPWKDSRSGFGPSGQEQIDCTIHVLFVTYARLEMGTSEHKVVDRARAPAFGPGKYQRPAAVMVNKRQGKMPGPGGAWCLVEKSGALASDSYYFPAWQLL